MSKPKYIKDAIMWNRFVGEKGAWVRASELNLIGDSYFYAFSGRDKFCVREAYPYKEWMEKYVGTCNDLRKDENFKKNK